MWNGICPLLMASAATMALKSAPYVGVGCVLVEASDYGFLTTTFLPHSTGSFASAALRNAQSQAPKAPPQGFDCTIRWINLDLAACQSGLLSIGS